MKRTGCLVTAAIFMWVSAGRADVPATPVTKASKEVQAAREKGLDWLTKNQAKDGSWGKIWTVPDTSFACLCYLAASDEPYAGERGKALVKGLQFLLKMQKDGMFVNQRGWIHGQGFATLALSEAYGRSLFCKTKPDLDMKKVRQTVVQAVGLIEKNQSTSGGWWYVPGQPGQHEGSTTVCAVQALVSASNYGIQIDRKVLDKGFEYLKKCQTNQGGFNYSLGDGQNMKEGTAAGMATLGLMSKFDNQVMIKAYQFLLKITPAAISAERFPFYGHFYGCMGMKLLGQEFSDSKDFREKTAGYVAAAQKDILSWQAKDGSWANRGWMKDAGEAPAYSTAFATLVLHVPDGRLSIWSRTPPVLPKEKKK